MTSTVALNSRTAPAAPEPTPTPASGRDASGRFTANNSGGPGNPFARRVAALRSTVLDIVSAAELADVLRALLARAKQIAKKIGPVEVDMGDTACKVPVALAYIEKIEGLGRVGKKRKTMKC